MAYEVVIPEPSVFRHSARNKPVTDSRRGQGSVTTHDWSPQSPGTLQMTRFTGCGARRLQSIQGRTIDTPCMTTNRQLAPEPETKPGHVCVPAGNKHLLPSGMGGPVKRSFFHPHTQCATSLQRCGTLDMVHQASSSARQRLLAGRKRGLPEEQEVVVLQREAGYLDHMGAHDSWEHPVLHCSCGHLVPSLAIICTRTCTVTHCLHLIA